MKLIHDFSYKWNEIGLGLGFTQPELSHNIASKPLLQAGAPTSYLRELLSQWVQWPTKDHPHKPTMEALCKALRSSLVGLEQLANEVEREMKHSTTGNYKESHAQISLY